MDANVHVHVHVHLQAPVKTYTLIGPDGRPYQSEAPGTLGGHRRRKGYGRLDCRSALQWIAKGHYVKHRVFFADEATAIAAGYRPCAVCMPEQYQEWKARNSEKVGGVPGHRPEGTRPGEGSVDLGHGAKTGRDGWPTANRAYSGVP